jgi:hypothetical protein
VRRKLAGLFASVITLWEESAHVRIMENAAAHVCMLGEELSVTPTAAQEKVLLPEHAETALLLLGEIAVRRRAPAALAVLCVARRLQG